MKTIKNTLMILGISLLTTFTTMATTTNPLKAKKHLRLKRFNSKGGNKKLFNLLNNKQMNDVKKIKFCDYVVVNEKNLSILKKNLFAIIEKYE